MSYILNIFYTTISLIQKTQKHDQICKRLGSIFYINNNNNKQQAEKYTG